MSRISLNTTSIGAFLLNAAAARVTARLNAKSHDNTDGLLSPSQWFFDSAHTIRHGMHTDMHASAYGSTIRLTLSYSIRTLQV